VRIEPFSGLSKWLTVRDCSLLESTWIDPNGPRPNLRGQSKRYGRVGPCRYV